MLPGMQTSPGSWAELESANQIVVDKFAADILASHQSAFGPFESVDDFFFWALDDRRLNLEQILDRLDRTAGSGSVKAATTSRFIFTTAISSLLPRQ